MFCIMLATGFAHNLLTNISIECRALLCINHYVLLDELFLVKNFTQLVGTNSLGLFPFHNRELEHYKESSIALSEPLQPSLI